MTERTLDAIERGEDEFLHRARIVFILRFLLALACASSLAIIEGGDVFSSPRFRYAYILLLCSCILDLAYIPVLRTLGYKRGQIYVHILIDLLFISALVYLTGGTGSPFVVLYFGSVMASAYLLAVFPAFLTPLLATLGLCTVIAVFHFTPARTSLPFISEDMADNFRKVHENLSPLVGSLFLQTLAFFAVTVLAHRLLRSASRERIVITEIIESMGDGILTVDRFGNVAMINPSARLIFDLPAGSELVGQSVDVLLDPAVHGTLATRLREGKEGKFESVLRLKGGRPAFVEISTWPIMDEKNRHRGTVAIVKDLSLEKEFEEVQRTADRLKDVREMAAGIAHEIRNPLTSIRGSIQELTTSGVIQEPDKKLMSIILKESDRLNNIITEFLELTARRALNLRVVNLRTVIDDVVLLLSKRPERGRSKIRTELPDELPARVDVEMMREVFVNLGVNALQAMPEMGLLHIKAQTLDSMVRGTAEDRKARKVPGLSISFMDTGPGIEKDMLSQIFVPFFSTKQKGTGIGLSLVQRTVDAHGGTLNVDSTPGTGTTFTLWLPQGLEEEAKT